MATFSNPVVFRGTATFLGAVTLPAGTITNAMVSAGAGIGAEKLQHSHKQTYAQPSGDTPSAEAKVVHVCRASGGGTIVAFRCGCVVAPASGEEVVFDLLINGATALTGQVTVNDSHAAYELVDGTIDTSSLSTDDVVEIKVVSNTGTTQKGAFAEVVVKEDYE